MTIQKGFILTRQARDIADSTQIELWLATDAGPAQLIIERERPVFFILQADRDRASERAAQLNITIELKPLELKDFQFAPLAACYMKTLRQSNALAAALTEYGITSYETDIRLTDRYLMERFIQGSLEFSGAQISATHRQFTQVRCRSGDYIPALRLVSLDLECLEKGLLYSIGLHSPMDSRVIMVGESQAADTAIEWVEDELALDRVGGSVAAFTNLYLPHLHRAGYAAPNLHAENWTASPGGYVMDSIPGLYDSVLVLDFKSLYPSIIRSFLIDPLGLIEGLQLTTGRGEDQAVPGFRGARFHRERHFLPGMIQTLWAARDKAKRNKQKAFSQAIKIIMNSFYGVLGASGCRFFDSRLASSITMRGHEIMKQTRTLIEEQGYRVIYGDTDSIFVSLNGVLTQEAADVIGRRLVTHINRWWSHHLRDEYNLTSMLELEYETHYRKFLMPTIRGTETGSKKRYAGLSGEGEQERIVFKGLESARTDWTPLAQNFQLQLYRLIFRGEEPDDYVREFVERTRAGQFNDQLVYRKRLRRKLQEYQKNVPPQVRAARKADEINAQLGRALQYQNKGRIEYVMTINEPEPREYQNSAIDYQHYIDKQLQPVADAILPFIGRDFEQLSAPQLGLF